MKEEEDKKARPLVVINLSGSEVVRVRLLESCCLRLPPPFQPC